MAVEIPGSLRESCAAITTRLAGRTKGVSWVKTANLHLTLKFLGLARPAQLVRLVESLAHKASKTEPFDIEMAGLGCFPSTRRARVIWVGVGEGSESLRALAEKVEGAADKAGFPRESRAFAGHLTLGRVRMPGGSSARVGRQGPAPGDVAPDGDLADLVTREDPGALGRFRVAELVLMHSRLDPGGAVHTPLHRLPLGRGQVQAA